MKGQGQGISAHMKSFSFAGAACHTHTVSHMLHAAWEERTLTKAVLGAHVSLPLEL